jgi:hypothetical protein
MHGIAASVANQQKSGVRQILNHLIWQPPQLELAIALQSSLPPPRALHQFE